MPYFVIGMPLIIIFAAGLGWFPTSGMPTFGAAGPTDPIAACLDFGRHLVLPLATVSLGLIGGYSILMRSSIIETRSEDYITTARAKGLTDGRILRDHAFPNAMLPMVTIIAINLGYVVAGAITAEVVFNWPGLGTLTVDALGARDYPVLQGVFLLLSITVVLANLVADLVYGSGSAGAFVSAARRNRPCEPRAAAGGCGCPARARPPVASSALGRPRSDDPAPLQASWRSTRRWSSGRSRLRRPRPGRPIRAQRRAASSGPTSSVATSST